MRVLVALVLAAVAVVFVSGAPQVARAQGGGGPGGQQGPGFNCDPLNPMFQNGLQARVRDIGALCATGCNATCTDALQRFNGDQCAQAACSAQPQACFQVQQAGANCSRPLPGFTACNMTLYQQAFDRANATCNMTAPGSGCPPPCGAALAALQQNGCFFRFCLSDCQQVMTRLSTFGCRSLPGADAIPSNQVQRQQTGFIDRTDGGRMSLNVPGTGFNNRSVSLVVPADALPQANATANLAVSELLTSFQSTIQLQNGGTGAAYKSPMFAFTPHGQTFDSAVTIQVPYDSDTTLGANQRLCVVRAETENSTQAFVLPACGTRNTTGMFVSVDVTSFSVYAVAAVESTSGAAATAAGAALLASALAALLALLA